MRKDCKPIFTRLSRKRLFLINHFGAYAL